MSELPPLNGIRAEDDGDRSPEFIATREQLVSRVNTWLAYLARKRDAAEPLSDGITITDEPRIVTTMLGRSGINSSAMIEGMRGGTSLTGKPDNEHMVLQAVRRTDGKGGVRAIQAAGYDPIAEQFYDGQSNGRRSSEIRASFGMREFTGDDEHSFKYMIHGSGAIRREFITDQGVTSSMGVRTVEDLQLAQAAFEQITELVN